jgi:hypothetical protein
MNQLKIAALGLAAVIALSAPGAVADDAIDFDFLASTPVGSWQEREQVVQDGGKETVTVVRVKYLGDEERGGETFAWIETEMSNFKVKKGQRKPQGEPMAVKFLMKKSLLEGDVVNAVGAFSDLAAEIVMQTGDSQPMRIKGAGSMMDAMTQAMGFQMEYDFSRDGSETVTVPAGTFDCDRYLGQGTSTVKVMIKTITVDSRSTQWLSDEVPFGIVKVVSDDTVNGKPQHSESQLLAFGTSGATSVITGEPQDLEMPSLGGIFGG